MWSECPLTGDAGGRRVSNSIIITLRKTLQSMYKYKILTRGSYKGDLGNGDKAEV